MTGVYISNPPAWSLTPSLSYIAPNDDRVIYGIDLGFDIGIGRYRGRYANLCNNGWIEFPAHDSDYDDGNVLQAPFYGGWYSYGSNYEPASLITFWNPMVAGLWYDIDTRTEASGLCRFGQITINGQKAFRAEWNRVGAFPYVQQYSTFSITIYDVGSGGYKIESRVQTNNAYQWTENPPQPSQTVTIGLGLGIRGTGYLQDGITHDDADPEAGRVDREWRGRSNTNAGLYRWTGLADTSNNPQLRNRQRSSHIRNRKQTATQPRAKATYMGL